MRVNMSSPTRRSAQANNSSSITTANSRSCTLRAISIQQRPVGSTSTRLKNLVPVDRTQRAIHPLGPNFDNRVAVPLANGTVRQTALTDTLSWNPRAFILGPASWNVDASVFKNFTIRESIRLRFTADLFNAFNHPISPNPDPTTGLQDLTTQTNSPRIIQLSLKLQW